MKKSNNPISKKCISSSSAFSLLEIAISIILIALIVVGIIGGSRIIKNAKISATISEMSTYSADANAFYDRFEQYPGDFNMASTMLVDNDGNTINNGNHDDLIGNIDFSENESAGFFHHLRLAGIIPATPFNGEAVSNAQDVVLDENYPSTKFSNDTFYYVSSDTVDGKYSRNNRLVIASTVGSTAGAILPQDAKSIDTKIDDSIPLTGRVIAHNADTSTSDSSCVIGGVGNFDYAETIPEAQYNTTSSSNNCILKKRLDGGEEVIAAPSCGAACPTIGDDGQVYDPCDLANLPATVNGKSITSWSGEVTHGSVATGVCDVATYGSGSATATCNDGTWGSISETCVAYSNCSTPYPTEATYNVASWTPTDNSDPLNGITDEHGDTIVGVCATNYEENPTNGAPIITCDDGSWDEAGVTGSCDALACASDVCTDNTDYYCGDVSDCSDGNCCSNSITGGGIDTSLTNIMGDCYQNCTNASFGNDTVNNASNYASGDCISNCSGAFGDDDIDNPLIGFGDCFSDCTGTMGNDNINGAELAYGDAMQSGSGTMGNDTITNTSSDAYGDCWVYCSGTMGDDNISNTGNNAYGDCYSHCSGVMGNDTITNTTGSAYGDCVGICGDITSWATDIFRNTGSNSFTIGDFNAGGRDDKIELPSGVSISIAGTGYSRTLTYTGSYSGTITIQCNSSENDCNASGSWAVKACNIYIGGAQQSSCTGCDAGTCSFN